MSEATDGQTSTDADFVTLGQLALELGMPKSNLRRWAIDRGIFWHKRRIMGTAGNAMQAALTREEADAVRRLRREAGFIPGDSPAAPVIDGSIGHFYVVALVPELDPNRLKFGYAASVASRMTDHRVVAPTLRLLRSWPCRSTWERPAIDCLSVICRLVGGEVYQAENVEDVLARADLFFSLLPPIQQQDKKELPDA